MEIISWKGMFRMIPNKPQRHENGHWTTEDSMRLMEKLRREEKDMELQHMAKMKRNKIRRREEQRRMQRSLTIAAVACILVVILMIAGCVSCTGCCHTTEEKKTQETSAKKTTDEKELDRDSAIQAVTQISDQPEKIDNKPEYPQNKSFTLNTGRLSNAVRNTFDSELTAEYIAVYDVTADEFIYVKNGDKKCYPASTTKMLTAIVASSIIKDPQTVITVGDEIKMIGEDSSSACLEEGMQLTFEMLIDALLLPSGNDAAHTIAVNCARIYKDDPKLSNEEAVSVFMELVNDAAEKIGAKDTHFVTPDGWHDDDHYTTAIDLAKIGAYVKTVPLVSKSCSKNYVEWTMVNADELKKQKKTSSLAWMNSNKLIQWDSTLYSEYCDGLKTGFTDQAGTSVVASATMEGHTFIAAVMDADNLYSKYEDCHKIFKEAFALYDLNYTFG